MANTNEIKDLETLLSESNIDEEINSILEELGTTHPEVVDKTTVEKAENGEAGANFAPEAVKDGNEEIVAVTKDTTIEDKATVTTEEPEAKLVESEIAEEVLDKQPETEGEFAAMANEPATAEVEVQPALDVENTTEVVGDTIVDTTVETTKEDTIAESFANIFSILSDNINEDFGEFKDNGTEEVAEDIKEVKTTEDDYFKDETTGEDVKEALQEADAAKEVKDEENKELQDSIDKESDKAKEIETNIEQEDNAKNDDLKVEDKEETEKAEDKEEKDVETEVKEEVSADVKTETESEKTNKADAEDTKTSQEVIDVQDKKEVATAKAAEAAKTLIEKNKKKKEALKEQVALTVANENNDRLFIELVEATALANRLKNAICEKYNDVAEERAETLMEELKVWEVACEESNEAPNEVIVEATETAGEVATPVRVATTASETNYYNTDFSEKTEPEVTEKVNDMGDGNQDAKYDVNCLGDVEVKDETTNDQVTGNAEADEDDYFDCEVCENDVKEVIVESENFLNAVKNFLDENEYNVDDSNINIVKEAYINNTLANLDENLSEALAIVSKEEIKNIRLKRAQEKVDKLAHEYKYSKNENKKNKLRDKIEKIRDKVPGVVVTFELDGAVSTDNVA